MYRCALVALTLTCWTLGLWADDKPAQANDLVAGTWEIVSMLIDGEANQVGDALLTCKDGSYTLKIGDRQIEAGKYTLDAKVDPKTIDLEITDGDDRGKKQLGIWKMENQQLVVCFAYPAADKRPKEFSGAKGSDQILVRMKKRAS